MTDTEVETGIGHLREGRLPVPLLELTSIRTSPATTEKAAGGSPVMTGVVVTIGTADTSTGIGGGSTMTIGAAPAGRGVVVGLPSAIGIRSVIESEIVILTADKFFLFFVHC